MRTSVKSSLTKQGLWVFLFALRGVESSAAEALRDVKPPVAYPSPWMLWVSILTGLAFLAVTVWALLRYRKRRKEKQGSAAPPSVLPWQKAFALLDDLAREDLLAQARIEEYYTRLSDILRHYLEEELGIRAPEMTTEEFLTYIQDHAALNNVQKNQLKAFLKDCDMVKFACYEPDVEKGRRSLLIVRELIQETKRTSESFMGEKKEAKETVQP